MTFLKTIGLAAGMGLYLLGGGTAFAQDSTSATPLFTALETETKTVLTVDRIKACLLGTKVVEKGIDYDLIKSDSKKAVRAKNSILKYEILLQDRSQTDVIFKKNVAEIHSEYDVFKGADKKERKRLFGIAKDSNKACGRSVERMKEASIVKTQAIANLTPNISSDTARTCYAISAQSMDSIADLLDSLRQSIHWNRVYQNAKRREGHPEGEMVEALKIKEEREALKKVDTDRALRLFDECKDKYKKAAFEYKLSTPTEAPEMESVVTWNDE